MRLIQAFTREAGVRNLEREIANVARKVARRVASDAKTKVVVKAEDLEEYLGPGRFEYGELEAEDQIGMVTGLVVSDAGGDIVQVEATRMDGKDDFLLTGQLGDVMKESARAGMSYIRARQKELGIDPGVFEKSTVHIHVPGGRDAKGRSERRRHDGDGDGQPAHEQAGPPRPGHDGRDHAARPGAAHRRPQVEAARRASRRRQDGPHPEAQREGSRRRAGRGASAAPDRAGREHGPGAGRGAHRGAPVGCPDQGGARRATAARHAPAATGAQA